MKKHLVLMMTIILLSGCAAYKYELALKDYSGGYVMRRHGLLIPEYTIDANGNAPQDKKIAESRFRRRKNTVNYYYKAMGRIYDDALSRLSDMRKMVTGPFRLPGAAIEDYKYEHDPEYREEADAQRFGAEMEERQRKNELKRELLYYIKRDMDFEKDFSLD